MIPTGAAATPDGAARRDPGRLLLLEANDRGGVVEQRILPEWGDPFEAEWRAFHASVVERTEPVSSPADFREDLELFRDMVELMAAPDPAVVS
jgi:predicted dehydrogenase